MKVSEAAEKLGDLLARFSRGEISGAEAIRRAATPEVSQSVTKDDAIMISTAALDMSRDSDADSWRPGVVLHLLLNASLDTLDQNTVLSDARLTITWNWIGVVAMALWNVPDPELYKDALARGESSTALLRQAQQTSQEAQFMHQLGMMHLDPLVALRSASLINQELSEWRDRASAGGTWNGVKYKNLEEDGFPSVDQTLAKARTYFKAAADLQTGRKRGLSLKALAQTLHAYAIFGLEVDRDAMADSAREALTLLDAQKDVQMIAEAAAYLRYATGNGASVPSFQEWFDRSLDALVDRLGAEQTKVGVLHVASNELDREPERAFKLLRDAVPLFATNTAWALQSSMLSQMRSAFTRSFGFQVSDFDSTESSSIEDLATSLRDRAAAESWDPARLAAALIALANYSPKLNEEAKGLTLIEMAKAIAPISTAPLETALADLRAKLLVNEGANAASQEDWARAAVFYGMALDWAIDQRAAGLISNMLDRLADVVKRGGISTTGAIVETLRHRADIIEVIGQPTASSQLQEIYRLAVMAIIENKGSISDLWSLMQLAKGRRFAAMIVAGCAHFLNEEDRAPLLLHEIAETRQQAGDAGVTIGQPFADAVLVSPYSLDSLQLSGGNAPERLLNLEHKYDVDLHERLVVKSANSSGLLANEESVRGVLDDDTVLVQFYYPSVSDTSSLLLMSITTQDATEWRSVKVLHSSGSMRIVADGFEAVFTHASSTVQSLRTSLVDDPDDGKASRSAREEIVQMTKLLIGPISDLLAAHRSKGRSHLCIVPHGPLAFAPLHLLGSYPRTLSDDWTVTYLPNLQLLSMHHGATVLKRYRNRKLASFGLSFVGDVRGYREIPEAVLEARACATAFGERPTLDDEATEKALRDALINARSVHIATHGSQREMAPCFQMLCLSPADNDDGAFYAHEVLGMDLRGLELVTLSACETALGRFDVGDNPHGLPASLFLAGAQTIIGTLWEIESNCSAYFFESLYSELAKAASCKLDAFRKALAATRVRYPQFRDWGAFYFAGDWR